MSFWARSRASCARNAGLALCFRGWSQAPSQGVPGAVPAAALACRAMSSAARRRARAVPRVRQHVNPLKSRFQVPCAPPHWDRVFERLDQPLFLDVGCGSGSFAYELALERTDWNVLALDIRSSIVDTPVNRERAARCPNLHYMATNVNVSMDSLLRSIPTSMPLRHVALLHPDPWVKKKHHKRRILNPSFISSLQREAQPGLQLLLQTDVPMLLMDMREVMAAFPRWREDPKHWPVTIPTARELFATGKGLAVFRTTYTLDSTRVADAGAPSSGEGES
mmetsp:Transcript_9106/g.28814  ORF Transcript_9106/g.28814 Transcript_9106/m.28814 type:complete len:279 (+) Transcript_9106:19-855(+)